MDIRTNVPLKNHTTMQIGGNARFMGVVRAVEDIPPLCQNADQHNLPIFVLGSGSNIIAHDEGYSGIVAQIMIKGFEILSDNPESTTIKVGAGEIWDEVVARTVEMGLTGIEAMSAIPGTAGAAPVQNVGAYGQEVSDTLVSLEAYDRETGRFVVLQNSECGFSYRQSIFRGEAQGRYIITSITLTLLKLPPSPPFYDSLQKYFDDREITNPTPLIIRNAVIEIRRDKLPNPDEKPNAGSFFKNAVVEKWQLDDLLSKYGDIPSFELGDGKYKIPTGWLIEHAGFKGQLLHGMRVHSKNALVLINESAGGYSDLAQAREEIIDGVRDTFQILIEQEPLEI